jgi:DNA-binding XRE family transcriptional regulator
MSNNRSRGKVDWSPEDRARHNAIREKFQREKPTHEQLLASGDYLGPLPLGVYLGLLEALAQLRKAREEAGLSLADVAERTGIDKAALSRLETGKQPNPTVETLMRYATAVGKQLSWSLRDVEETVGS